MHPNASFRHNDTDFRSAMIRQGGFATLFLTTPDGPRAAHTPVHLASNSLLQFHLARTNTLVPHLDGARALAVLNGPEAYVSARWYEDDNQVPTWNYVAFELEGIVRRIDPDALISLLDNLSNHHEAMISDGEAWHMQKMDKSILDKLVRGIVGFELQVDQVRETIKLSQNKPKAERERLIAGLDGEGKIELTKLMREIGK